MVRSIRPGDTFLQSRPVRVTMLGMESTTLSMQRAGWEFSVDFEMPRMTYRVIARNRDAKLYALSSPVEAHMFEDHRSMEMFPVINFCGIGSDMIIHMQETPQTMAAFQPVDMEPRMVQMKNIEDFNLFAGVKSETKEIYVPPQQVEGMLGLILEAQEEGAQAYYEEQVRAARRESTLAQPAQRTHVAQIVSIA